MKINKKIVLGLTLSFLLTATAVYATSSTDFFTKAKNYIDSNCAKAKISDAISLNCYLFYKIGELGTQVDSNTSRIVALENAPSPTPAPTPSPFTHNELKTFDANNTELGLFISPFMFFYPPINRLVDIQTRKLGYGSGRRIYYLNVACTGDAYIGIGDNDLSFEGNKVFSNIAGEYFILEPNTPAGTVNYGSYSESDGCVFNNSSGTANGLRLLKKVSINLPDPVPFPLQYKYQ